MSKRLEMFDKLLSGGSKDPFHHYARAMELRALGRRDEALAALTGVTASFPDYVASYLMAAQLANELGDAGRAKELAVSGVAAAKRAGDEHAVSELEALLAST